MNSALMLTDVVNRGDTALRCLYLCVFTEEDLITMRITTPILTRALAALTLAAFCSGAHAQDASGASTSDSSVFASADAGDGGSASDLSMGSTNSSSLSSGDTSSLVTDVGVGLVGVSLLSLLHGGSSSSGAGTNDLTSNASPAAVPEASSVVSFGLLLTLGVGGLIVTTRKRRTA